MDEAKAALAEARRRDPELTVKWMIDHTPESSGRCSTASARRGCRRNEASLKAALRERVRCSSLVDWPVYPRLRRTMLTTPPKRNPASKSNGSDPRH